MLPGPDSVHDSREESTTSRASISRILHVPKKEDIYLVCPKGPALFIINDQGHILKRFHMSPLKSADFVTCTISPGSRYIYAANEHHELVVFDVETGKVELTWNIHDKDVTGILHHPTRNLLLTYAQDGLTRFWK